MVIFKFSMFEKTRGERRLSFQCRGGFEPKDFASVHAAEPEIDGVSMWAKWGAHVACNF